jgi:hypothetical protein
MAEFAKGEGIAATCTTTLLRNPKARKLEDSRPSHMDVTAFGEWVLQRCSLPQLQPWACVDYPDEERASHLMLLPRFLLLNRTAADFVAATAEYAAFRLAQAEVRARPPRRSAHRGVLIVRTFDKYFAILSKSWVLHRHIPEHLRTSPLSDLDLSDLQCLCSHLQSGWPTEYISCFGDSVMRNVGVWVTPLLRV